MKILHLVLTHHWYNEVTSGHKYIEYRQQSPHWKKLIWDKKEELTHVRFAKGYSKEQILRKIKKIDIGTCPYEGWDEDYYRIEFEE